MARNQTEYTKALIVLEKWKDHFEDIDYMTPLDSYFGVGQFIQTWQEEATAKGLCVSIRVSLIDPAIYMEPTPESKKELDENDEPTEQ